MNLFIELVSMAGEMLAAHIRKHQWPKWKIFLIPAITFCGLFTLQVLLDPPEKGVLAGLWGAVIFGLLLGLFFLLIFSLKNRFGKSR